MMHHVGAHFNPAVTLGVRLTGRDHIRYVVHRTHRRLFAYPLSIATSMQSCTLLYKQLEVWLQQDGSMASPTVRPLAQAPLIDVAHTPLLLETFAPNPTVNAGKGTLISNV
jgi:hypothetical protein